VLDVGCGTGILSIIAEKLGAMKITGIDIDPWSFENALENVQLNHSAKIEILNVDVSHLPVQIRYDIILANINRQIILDNIETYSSLLHDHGFLICSGFLLEDKEMILREANRNQLGYEWEKTMNKWSSLVFQKKTN
jgi:ribosomal protein L11 methyltransferase